jgi:hypothetical protein
MRARLLFGRSPPLVEVAFSLGSAAGEFSLAATTRGNVTFVCDPREDKEAVDDSSIVTHGATSSGPRSRSAASS